MPLNHVALTVADRERSAAFYGEHFGLTERVHEDEDRLILGSEDGSELALSQGEPAAASLPHTNHFGFRLADEDAVRAARERFRARRRDRDRVAGRRAVRARAGGRS